MEKLLKSILSGDDLSGEQMAAELGTNWEKFEDAYFFSAMDKSLAENLLKLSDKIAENPGIFTITLSAKKIPGATLFVEYGTSPANFDDSYRCCDEGEVQEVLDGYEKDDVFFDTDTYLEISEQGIGFIAQTESGNCEMYIDKDDFRSRMEKAFSDDTAPRMGM